MREFVFDLVYGPEVIEGPDGGVRSADVRSTGMGGCQEEQRFWRVERLEGPEDALERVGRDLQTSPLDLDRVTERGCESKASLEELGRTKTTLELYCRIDRIGGCETVYTLASEYLGIDVLFEFERDGATETWRVLMGSDEKVGLLYDALQVTLRPGISFEFGHIGDAAGWRTELVSHLDIPIEQRTALELAVERGYYETPREVTLDELADVLDWPRSTLSYRLRRAESRLVKAFSARGVDDALEKFSATAGTEEDQ